MWTYFGIRIQKRSVWLGLVVGISLSVIQIAQSLDGQLLSRNLFFESPYTRWLGMDPFNFSALLFYILLPLIAALPAGSVLHRDLTSGLIGQVKMRRNLKSTLWGYVWAAFITGALVVGIALSVNLAVYFMVLPNIRPDNLLNANVAVMSQNTLFVTLYYQHPLLHALLSLTFASFWAGLFAAFATITAFWINNQFLVLAMGFFLQIVLLVANTILRLPGQVSYVPMDFLKETANSFISLPVAGSVTLAMVLIIVSMVHWGGKRVGW